MPTLPKPKIKKPKTLNPRARFSNFQIMSFIAVFALIGGYLLYKTFAVTSPVFGTNIPAVPAFPISLPERTVANWTDLQSAVASGNVRVKVVGKINIPVDWRWTKPNIWVYGDPAGGAGFVGGSVKINTSDVWVSNLEIYGGNYDGIKLGDGAAASRIVIADNYIHDVGDQGVLIATNGAQDVWIVRNKIEKVNLTNNPSVQADGHGIYTGGYGGVTKRIYILSNEIHPSAFGVQVYPEPNGVVIAGNSIIGGDTRGGIVWYDGATNVTAVGNMIVDAPSAAFEVSSGGAAASSGNRADENVCLRCNLWTAGMYTPPGSGNISTTDQAVADSFRVRSDQWGWLPSFLKDGSVRTEANTGSSFSGGASSSTSPAPSPVNNVTVKPMVPSGLTATASDGKVIIGWSANPPADSVDSYQVYWTTDSTWNSAPQQDLTVSGTSYTVSGLNNNTTYHFRASAHNSAGYSDWTAAVSALPVAPAASVSSPPTITQNIKPGGTLSGALIWTATTTATNIASVSFDMDYDKTLSVVDSSAPFTRILDTTKFANGSHVLGLTVTLKDGSVLWQPYQIGSVSFANSTPAPAPKPTPPPTPSVDTTKPSTPKNFRVTATSKTQLSLAWDASTDNVNVVGYKLTRSLQQIYDGPKLAVTNYDLNASSKYSYYVNAYDAAGNVSAPSQRICVGKWSWWSSVTRSRSWKYC